MRRIFGVGCICLGICCLVASVAFWVCNRLEEERAGDASVIVLQNIQQNIAADLHEESGNKETEHDEEIPQDEDTGFDGSIVDDHREMLTIQVDGYDCIGVLSIPVLEIELLVLTDWSYAKLKIAPCHYYGTYYGKDFVIAAHNYQTHFGRLPELQPKDLILFTDISGKTHYYEVVLLETLPANATKEMINSGFDLSLYTCTKGGGSRVTVRCSSVSAS